MTVDPLPELRALNAKFIHNFVTCDVASHDAIIHPRFECIMPDGRRMDRASYLKFWATGCDPNVIVYWDYRDERIAVVADTAFVSSTNKWIRIVDGKETPGMTRYVDTYVRENGKWLCALAQLTGLAQPHWPGDDTIVKKYVRGKMAG